MSNEAAPDYTAARTFDRLLATHENGDLNAELTKALNEAVAEVENHYQAFRKASKATITVTVEISHADGYLEVTAKMGTKLPVAPRPTQIYYATEKNELTRRDPKQRELPLHDVNNNQRTVHEL